MSTESRRRKALAAAVLPKTHVVVSLDTYMGDGEDAGSFGFAGINDIYGPLSEKEAEALCSLLKANDGYMFVEYRVYAMKNP